VQLYVAMIEFAAEDQWHSKYCICIQYFVQSQIYLVAPDAVCSDTEPMRTQDALFANDAFYLAFAARDLDHMDALWARESPVICLHPGWPALTRREQILESWARILSNPAQQPIDVYGAAAFNLGTNIAVICYEEVDGNVMVATNLFVEEKDRVLLACHQAGPCGQPPPRD